MVSVSRVSAISSAAYAVSSMLAIQVVSMSRFSSLVGADIPRIYFDLNSGNFGVRGLFLSRFSFETWREFAFAGTYENFRSPLVPARFPGFLKFR